MLQHSLDNITVVDFTQIGAGPTCTMYLGDLGARIIKVEPPNGDIGRELGPPWVGEDSAIYVAFNRNKESICLDMGHEEGRKSAWRLIQQADVVVESFRPGVMERFGLDYQKVRQEKPDIVYCSVSAYGQDGPYSRHAGVDGIVQAASGLMSLIGEAGGEPCKVQTPIVDIATGYLAAIAVLAALYRRSRTGKGIYLDANLFSSAIALQQSSLTGYLADSRLPCKLGSAAPYSAPNEAFPTRNGWIMVAAYSPGRWEALCMALGAAHLQHAAEFASSSQRVINRKAMRKALIPFFIQRTTEEWVTILDGVDILCSPVHDYDSLIEHPQLQSLDLIAKIQDQDTDSPELHMPGFPVRASEMSHRYTYPPAISQHADAILAWAGYSAEQISGFQASGVVRAPGERSPPFQEPQ